MILGRCFFLVRRVLRHLFLVLLLVVCLLLLVRRLLPVRRLLLVRRLLILVRYVATSSLRRESLCRRYVAGGSLRRRYVVSCLLYTSPSPRDRQKSRMPSSA